MVSSINTIMYNLELLNEKNSRVTYGLSSGDALQNGSDDSLRYDYLLTLQNNLSTYSAIEDRIDLSTSFNSVSDSSVASIKTAMESINSSMIKALSDTTNSEDKNIIALELEALKDTLLTLVNDTSTGEYLFSGNNINTTPFVEDETTGVISYVSDNSNRTINVEKNQYTEQGINGIDLIYYTNETAQTGDALTFSSNEIILDEDGNEWKILDTDADGTYDGLYLNGDSSSTMLALTTNADGTFTVTNTLSTDLESKHSYFDDLNDLIGALKQEDTSGNAISDAAATIILKNSLDKFDLAYDNTNYSHAELGSKTNTINNYSQIVASKITNYTSLELAYGSADLTYLAIESKALENTYTALYSTINQISDLSLVKYLT